MIGVAVTTAHVVRPEPRHMARSNEMLSVVRYIVPLRDARRQPTGAIQVDDKPLKNLMSIIKGAAQCT